MDPDGWRVTLVTNLRVLGYVFNPASFFLCRDDGGELRVVVVEVHNTYGERHLYTLRARVGRGGPFVAAMDKAFFVSPFIEDGAAATPSTSGTSPTACASRSRCARTVSRC